MDRPGKTSGERVDEAEVKSLHVEKNGGAIETKIPNRGIAKTVGICWFISKKKSFVELWKKWHDAALLVGYCGENLGFLSGKVSPY